MKSVLVLRHEPSVSMGSLAGVLAEAGLDARQFDLFETRPDALPWSEAAGLIVLGGTISANDGDRFPFLVAELDWIREAVRRHVPLLGICLGAQLLAKALGAAVYRNARAGNRLVSRSNFLPAAAEDRSVSRPLGSGRPSFIGTATPSICRPAPSTWHKARLPASGISLRCDGLWTAIPRGDDARVDGSLAAGVRRRGEIPSAGSRSIPQPFARPRPRLFRL